MEFIAPFQFPSIETGAIEVTKCSAEKDEEESIGISPLGVAAAVAATGASLYFLPVALPVVAFNGVRAYLAATAIENDPLVGTAGLVLSVGADLLIPGSSSSGKYLVQTGKSLHRVKDLSQVAEGAKLLVQTGKSIHRVAQAASYVPTFAGDSLRAVTYCASAWSQDGKKAKADS